MLRNCIKILVLSLGFAYLPALSARSCHDLVLELHNALFHGGHLIEQTGNNCGFVCVVNSAQLVETMNAGKPHNKSTLVDLLANAHREIYPHRDLRKAGFGGLNTSEVAALLKAALEITPATTRADLKRNYQRYLKSPKLEEEGGNYRVSYVRNSRAQTTTDTLVRVKAGDLLIPADSNILMKSVLLVKSHTSTEGHFLNLLKTRQNASGIIELILSDPNMPGETFTGRLIIEENSPVIHFTEDSHPSYRNTKLIPFSVTTVSKRSPD
jgi:hypothetical protein